MNHESKHDQGWKTFHQIEEPFQDGDGEAKLHELVARIEAWGEPEELILLAADHLKQFAAQHVQDLDALLTEVAEIWSTASPQARPSIAPVKRSVGVGLKSSP